MNMIEKIRDLVTAGEGVFEIKDIDNYIDKISRDHKRLGDVKEALGKLKSSGVNNVLLIDLNSGVIRIKSDDMIKVAMTTKVDIEEKGERTYGNVLVGDVNIFSLLNPNHIFDVKRESGAFVFSPGVRARNLIEFIDAVTKSDDSSVEHFFYNGDFETWFKSIGKIDLAKGFAKRKRRGLLGRELKKDISGYTLKYIKTNVKRQVKKEVRQRLLKSIKEL